MSSKMSKNTTCVDVYNGGYNGNGYGYERVQVQQNNGNNGNGTCLSFPHLCQNGIQAYGTIMKYNPTFDLDQNNFNVMEQAKDAASNIINNNANSRLAKSRMIQDRQNIRASTAKVASMESTFTYHIPSSPATFSIMY